MTIYDRIKTLLEVSGRDNTNLLGRISAKHAHKANKEKNFDLKSPDRKLAKKYGTKRNNTIKDIDFVTSIRATSRIPGSKHPKGSYYGT